MLDIFFNTAIFFNITIALYLFSELERTSLTTTVNVTIRLLDENDNQPTFSQVYYSTVVTGQNVGMHIVTVQARDFDQGENGTVVYSIVKGKVKHYFSIDSRLVVLEVCKILIYQL